MSPVITNPYNYNLPVEPDMFFGRDEDLKILIDNVTAPRGDSFALIGGRRMGKTSLLEMMQLSLENRIKNETTTIMTLPIMLDFTGEDVNSATDFFQAVKDETEMFLVDLLSTPLPQISTRQLSAPVFGKLLEKWDLRLLKEHKYRLRLILLLDECEQITEKPWTDKLYSNLRFLLDRRQTRELIKLVMCGSHRFLTQVRQHGSPLHNILRFHTLAVLNGEATTKLIKEPIGNQLSNEVVEKVVFYSGGHPFLTQYIMHYLTENDLAQAELEIIDHIATLMFPRERSDFLDWTNKFMDTSLQAYRLLIDRPLTIDEIRSSLKPVSPDLLQALNTLCYHGLVVQEADQKSYRIAGQMFREWFITNISGHLEQTHITSSGGMNYVEALARMHVIITEQATDHLSDFLTLEARLRENLHSSQISGDTPTTQSERIKIVTSLNTLAHKAQLEVTFNDLCRE